MTLAPQLHQSIEVPPSPVSSAMPCYGPGKITRSSVIMRAVLLALGFCASLQLGAKASPTAAPNDKITIHESSGKAQLNRPVSVSRAFRQGEIANFVQASIGSTPL